MPFEKGHPYVGGGKKGRSGRKKSPDTIVKEAIESLRSDLPDILERLRLKALDGDREAAIYLIDRAIGKPKQQTELTGGEHLGAEAMRYLIMMAAQNRSKQLTGGNDATIKEEDEEK